MIGGIVCFHSVSFMCVDIGFAYEFTNTISSSEAIVSDIDILIVASVLLQIPVQALFRVDGQSYVGNIPHLLLPRTTPSQLPVRQPK